MGLNDPSKKSESDSFPNDWSVKTLGELATVVRGASPRPAGDPRYFNGDFIPWLTVAALTRIPDFEMCVSETTDHLTEEGSKHSRTLPKDTLIVANSGATLGVAKILSITCCANDGIAALINQVEGDKKYLCYYLNSQTKRLREVVATGNGQPNLNTTLIRSIVVPFPSEGEQRAIAIVLEDVDELLSGLEKVIAKKRDLKKGTMQQLLYGKRRLSGFVSKWDVKRFGEIAHPRKERTDPRRMGVQQLCIELEHIDQKSGRLLGSTITDPQSSLKSMFRAGDVLFGKLRAYLRKYWLAEYDGVCSTEIWPLVPNDELVTPGFLFQTVMSDRFIKAASTSYGTHMPRSDWTMLRNYEIAIPSLEEQIAIAKVLSDMDAELNMLEQRRDKTHALKVGMMQALLTGKIRLAPAAVPSRDRESIPSPRQKHNWEFNEAVVISVLTKQFGSENFPLGRKRYTKLAYMLHRHAEREAKGYLKKAAGPYNPSTKYKGPEAIAQNKLYIRMHNAGRFSGFVAAENIVEAQNYFQKWYGAKVLPWLEQFRFRKNDELELLTTIDMAIQDLLKAETQVTLRSVKKVIRNHKEWRAKLQRPIFADAKIAAGIETCKKLFG